MHPVDTNPDYKQEAVDLMNEFLMKRAIPGKENDMKITESELTIDFILDERAREWSSQIMMVLTDT